MLDVFFPPVWETTGNLKMEQEKKEVSLELISSQLVNLVFSWLFKHSESTAFECNIPSLCKQSQGIALSGTDGARFIALKPQVWTPIRDRLSLYEFWIKNNNVSFWVCCT